MIAVSILGNKNIPETIKKIDKTDAEMLHVDVLDETYENPFDPFKEVANSKKALNVHLMVKDQMKYIKEYENLNVHLMVKDQVKYIEDYERLKPHSIILEYELCENPYELASHLWKKNIKAGFALAPDTDVSNIKKYLSLVDYVLVLTVHPGLSGQKYLDETSYKVRLLKKLRKDLNLNFKIIVDGGINGETIKKCIDADIFIAGSFITKSKNYQEKIDSLRENIL